MPTQPPSRPTCAACSATGRWRSPQRAPPHSARAAAALALALVASLAVAGGRRFHLACGRRARPGARGRATRSGRSPDGAGGDDLFVNMFSDADVYARARASELRAPDAAGERATSACAGTWRTGPGNALPLLHQLGRVLRTWDKPRAPPSRLGEAIDTYLELGDTAPLPELYNAYVSTLNRLGHHGDAWRAIEAWQRNAELQGPKVAHIDNAMGLVLTNLGELDRARQHLQRAVASEDQDIDRPDEARLNARSRIYFANLALVELVAGRAAEAERLVRSHWTQRTLPPSAATASSAWR